MGRQLARPTGVPVNKVRALDLQAELAGEYSKEAWRQAEARAWIKWRAEGGEVKRVAPGVPGGVAKSRRRGGYI